MAADDDRLNESLDALSKLLLSDEPLDAALARVTELAIASVPVCDAADVTLITEDGPRARVRSDPDGPGLDEVQLQAGEGPTIEAVATCEPVHVPSTRTATRWSTFARAAVDVGLASCLVAPMLVRGQCIGALNLYSRKEDVFGPRDERAAVLVASQAAVVLANAQLHQACVDLTGQLEEALGSRAVIDQAKGVLMERRRCSAEEAFEELRRRSQHENRKVRELAQDLVDEVSGRADR